MFKAEDILTRLQNGEDATAIANEMVNALNEANSRFQEEQNAKAKAAEAKEAQRVKDLQDILDMMYEFCLEYYCENANDQKVINDVFADLDAKSVLKMIDEIGQYAVAFEKDLKTLDSLFKAPTLSPKAPKVAKKDPDAAIKNFLNGLGL